MDAQDVLRQEFGFEPGSFTAGLLDARWDRGGFSRFEQAMREVCASHASRDEVPRWLAWGFYYFAWWIRAQTSHEAFARPEPADYYEVCLTRVSDLADWFFQGHHHYAEPHVWTDL